MGLPDLAFGQTRRTRTRVSSFVRIQDDGTVLYGRRGEMTEMGTIVKLPAGATYFHWTTPEAAESILTNGLRDLSLLTGGNVNNAMGSGFYAAENILDYGGTGRHRLITLEVLQPTSVILVTGSSWDPGLDQGDAHFRIKSKDVWDRAQEDLRRKGISGVMYRSAFSGSHWYNFFAPAGESYLVRPTRQEDVINLKIMKDPYNAYRALFQFNQIQPVVADTALYDFSPTLWKLASGQSLTPQERKELWRKAGSQLTTSRNHPRELWRLSERFIGGDSVLARNFRREFRRELDELVPNRIDLRRHGNASQKELEDKFQKSEALLKGWGYDVEANRPPPRLEVQAMAETLPDDLRELHLWLNDRTNILEDRLSALAALVELAQTDSRALAPLVLSYCMEKEEDPRIINRIRRALSSKLLDQMRAVKSLPIKDPQHLRNLIARMPKNLLPLRGTPIPWDRSWGMRDRMQISSEDMIPLLVLSKVEGFNDEVATAIKFFDHKYVYSGSEGFEMKAAALERVRKYEADRNRRVAEICQGSLLPVPASRNY